MRIGDTRAMRSRSGSSGGRLRRDLRPGYLVPDLESARTFPTVLRRTKALPSWAEMLPDRPKGGQEALSMACGFEALEDSLALACRLVAWTNVSVKRC